MFGKVTVNGHVSLASKEVDASTATQAATGFELDLVSLLAAWAP